jgi:hypothetical protein
MASTMTSQASNASMMSSQTTEQNRIKLRLCYGGKFEQVRSHQQFKAPQLPGEHPDARRGLLQGTDGIYKYVNGTQYNESVPADCKYADFMFKLSEKFDTAVSVKYLAPGDELAPDQLITVQDDDDFKVKQLVAGSRSSSSSSASGGVQQQPLRPRLATGSRGAADMEF